MCGFMAHPPTPLWPPLAQWILSGGTLGCVPQKWGPTRATVTERRLTIAFHHLQLLKSYTGIKQHIRLARVRPRDPNQWGGQCPRHTRFRESALEAPWLARSPNRAVMSLTPSSWRGLAGPNPGPARNGRCGVRAGRMGMSSDARRGLRACARVRGMGMQASISNDSNTTRSHALEV